MAEKLTPMMQQYQRMKRQAPPDALLLFRMGDFFELFYDDAKEGAEILNLTLTKRNGVPMCGVPHHAAEGYVGKLIQNGRRVAMCDQISEPKPGQVVDRAITQMFSPGCVVSLDLTLPKENRFLAAVHKGKQKFGFAFLDLTTGDFRLTEIADLRGVQDEVLRLQPKELLFPEEQGCVELPEGLSVRKTGYDDWVFEGELAELTLRDHFKVQSLDGFGCQNMPAGLGAAGALVHYVTKTLHSSASNVLALRTYSTLDFLVLDAVTQRNLELVESSSAAVSNTSLLKAIDHTVTAMGGRELRSWILHPLRDGEKIRARQDVIASLLTDVGRLEDFRSALQEVRDLERLMGRVAQGSGNARDVLGLRVSLEKIPELKKLVAELDAELARELSRDLREQPELIEFISRAIVEEPPLAVKEGGIIAPGYHAELDELRAATKEGKSWVVQLQAKEQERTGIKSLKVRFNQVFGYYIEVTKSNLAQVPPEYVRKQTMVNAERFITPELKEMESKILGAEERARKLEYDLFLQVRDRVAEKTREVQTAARALAQLDVLAGLAHLARLQDYHRPELSADETLEIIDGRHPVLEQQMRGEKFVPNDTQMNGDAHFIILTGPNMAGKSTYIRQVALIALLFHMGSYVPAQRAKIPALDRIFTRIGASDDLSRGQSTFMVEMNETANILNHATEHSLVILDEIGRGTSTFDGLSIAWAVAEHLAARLKAKTLFATHYHELTELSATLPGVKNYNVAVREWQDEIRFLHRIVGGGADKSYGIQVARLAGLPHGVLDRAKEILRNLEESELDAAGKPARIAARRGKNKSNELANPNLIKEAPAAPQMDLFKSFSAAKK